MACEQKVFASWCVHMASCTQQAVVMFLLCRFEHSLLSLLEELCHCPAALRPVRGRNKGGLEEELTAFSSFGNLWVANKATSLDEHFHLNSTDSFAGAFRGRCLQRHYCEKTGFFSSCSRSAILQTSAAPVESGRNSNNNLQNSTGPLVQSSRIYAH